MGEQKISDLVDVNELESIIPAMNVNVPAQMPEETNLITDDALLGIYAEILSNLREDREEITGLTSNFVEMVINEGDSTSSSKEALVNLVKIKTDLNEKMAKVADLMTRVKLKDRDTFKPYMRTEQNNTINIGDGAAKRELLRSIENAQKKKKGK